MRRLALLVLVGCAGGGDSTIDITHDACETTWLAAVGPSPVQDAAIVDAIGLWRDHGAPRFERGPGMLEIRFEAASAAFRGLYDDEHGIVYINSAITEPDALAIVIAHELGHALGLEHVRGGGSVMSPGNLETPPTAADQAALQALWGVCEPGDDGTLDPG